MKMPLHKCERQKKIFWIIANSEIGVT